MNILLIEDNEKLSKNISIILKQNDYIVDQSLFGREGLNKAIVNNYDLIILDLALPDMDGVDVCKAIRNKGKKTPILMLTARIDLYSKVNGLDSGADDYLTKPFLMGELLARIRALLRRSTETGSSIFKIGDIKIDLTTKEVSKKNKEVHLSPNEKRLLEFFVLNRGKVQDATRIYESVWGSENEDIIFSEALKVYISGIRKKLGKDIIRTVTGFGYIMD